MAPHKSIRTYERQNVSQAGISKSTDVFNKLLVKNLTKRQVIRHKKKKKIEIKEISFRGETNLSNNSLAINLDDTFDRLAKGEVLNAVRVRNGPVHNFSSETELSKSRNVLAHVDIRLQQTTEKSRRQRRKPARLLNSDDFIARSLEKSSDMVLRDCIENRSDKSITVSLAVEKECGKVDYATLSYIKLPCDKNNSYKTELQISIDSLRPNLTPNIVSSTPLISKKKSQFAQDLPNQSLVEGSYEEILKWNNTLPSAILPDSKAVDNQSEDANKDCEKRCSIPLKSSSLRVRRNLGLSSQDLSSFKGFSRSRRDTSKNKSKSSQKIESKVSEGFSEVVSGSNHMKDCRVLMQRISDSGKSEKFPSKVEDTKENIHSLYKNDLSSVLASVKQESFRDKGKMHASKIDEIINLCDTDRSYYLSNRTNSSNSTNSSVNRPHRYDVRNSVYITLRKREVLAKSFRTSKSTSSVSNGSIPIKAEDESKESYLDSDIIMETPAASKKPLKMPQREKNEYKRLSNLIVKLENRNSIVDNCSSSNNKSYNSTDIIPMTPDDSLQTLSKDKKTKCKSLGYSKGKCRNISSKKEPQVSLSRSSVPLSFYQSTINDEPNDHITNSYQKPYVLLPRLSLRKDLSRTDTLISVSSSSEDSSSLLVKQEFQFKEPVVELEQLASNIFYNVNDSTNTSVGQCYSRSKQSGCDTTQSTNNNMTAFTSKAENSFDRTSSSMGQHYSRSPHIYCDRMPSANNNVSSFPLKTEDSLNNDNPLLRFEKQEREPLVMLEKLPSYIFLVDRDDNNSNKSAVSVHSSSVQFHNVTNSINDSVDGSLSKAKSFNEDAIPIVKLEKRDIVSYSPAKLEISDVEGVEISDRAEILQTSVKEVESNIYSIITIHSEDESNVNSISSTENYESMKSSKSTCSRKSMPLAISTPYNIVKRKELTFNLSNIAEASDKSSEANSHSDEKRDNFVIPQPKVFAKPGKAWRRSLASSRASLLAPKMEYVDTNESVRSSTGRVERSLSKRLSVRIVPVTPIRNHTRESILGTYAFSKLGYVSTDQEVNGHLAESIEDLQQLSLDHSNQFLPDVEGPLLDVLDGQQSLPKKNHSALPEQNQSALPEKSVPTSIPKSSPLCVTARDIVLRRCDQTEPLPFRECYTNSTLHHCQKIGEGVYGEVFLFRNQHGGTTVMKIIPIEGDRMVNGEHQKKFEEILSEIVIAMELSNLQDNNQNKTSAFNQVMQVQCVQGSYPETLLDLWELYAENMGSENDSPEIFTDEQLFIVLELANGGKDLEAYVFQNAAQAYSVFEQTACALAVAEKELKFEHRDLHWGNILIAPVDKNKKLECILDGERIEMSTKGVEATIIDFTLSRIMFKDVVIYNDLSLDPELFTATGDYQFDIYRLMKKKNGNEWRHFEPHTNVLWLDYLLDKMIKGLRYKNTQTKVHKDYLEKLRRIKGEVFDYNSAKDLVEEEFM